MERRDFLKRVAGFSLALTAGGLALPLRAKCEVLKPFAEIVSNNYLDEIIRSKIIKIKQQNPELQVGDTHCHSYHSDGSYSVKDLMYRSASLGLDFLVVTEHLTPERYNIDCCLGSIAGLGNIADRWNYKDLKPPVVYPAIEISAREGHLIAVFPKEYFKQNLLKDVKQNFARFYHHETPVETAAKLIRKMGGVSIVAHPNIVRSTPFGISTEFVRKNLVGLVDAIEDISSGHGYQKSYSKELGLASIGSSDDHLNILIGTSLTSFDQSKQSDILQAIRNKSTSAIQTTDFLDPLFSPAKFFFQV